MGVRARVGKKAGLILVALALWGFGLVDLCRWSPGPVGMRRAAGAVVIGAVGAAALAGLAGACLSQILAVALVSLVVLAVWVGFDYRPLQGKSGLPFAWLGAVLLALFACSGSVGPISGPLESWYEQLDLAFVEEVSVDQFVLGLSAMVFMAASGNRLVRLVLDAAGVSLEKNESAVPGGRVLGPLERVLVFAIVLAGDPAAAAIVVTGKGLLRFPEIRSESRRSGPDVVTEYFLIGTLTSLVIAASLGVFVLAVG